jgi:rhamnose utilization protein RhaD (predicted bifunctional aldolase and dehydrogenase)
MQELNDLIEISRFYGINKSYVIAGGGNTSYKNKEVIYVKASGTTLADIDENGFVALDRKKLSVIATKEYSTNTSEREEQVKNDLMNSRLFPEKGQRPSVETSMHEIINFPYVIHTHPTIANSLLCSYQAEKTIEKLFGASAIFIKYTDPGYILFKKVKERIDAYKANNNGAEPQIIFLENHGVFVSANTTEEIKTIYKDIESKIKSLFKEELTISPLPEHPLTEEIKKTISRIMFDGTSIMTSARKNSLIDSFCVSRDAYNKVALPFTPDNIVYCKAHSIYIKSLDDIAIEIDREVNNFTNKHGYKPKVILIKNIGLFAIGDSNKSTEIILDVFEDLMKVSCGTMNFGGPKFLSTSEIEFIDNWEVENYRRNASKAK